MNQNNRIAFLAAVFALVFLFQFVYVPNMRRVDAARRLLTQKQKDAVQLSALITRSGSVSSSKSTDLAPADFSLFVFVSRAIEIALPGGRVTKITPVSENVLPDFLDQRMTIVFEDVDLERLLAFFKLVEEKPYLRFGYVQVAKNPLKPFLVKAEMEIAAYRPRK